MSRNPCPTPGCTNFVEYGFYIGTESRCENCQSNMFLIKRTEMLVESEKIGYLAALEAVQKEIQRLSSLGHSEIGVVQNLYGWLGNKLKQEAEKE